MDNCILAVKRNSYRIKNHLVFLDAAEERIAMDNFNQTVGICPNLFNLRGKRLIGNAVLIKGIAEEIIADEVSIFHLHTSIGKEAALADFGQEGPLIAEFLEVMLDGNADERAFLLEIKTVPAAVFNGNVVRPHVELEEWGLASISPGG